MIKKITKQLFLCAILFAAFLSPLHISADVSLKYGDLNGDGKINVMDTVRLKQSYLNETNSFPITNWRIAAGLSGENHTINTACISDLNKYLMNVTDDGSTKPGQEVAYFNGIDVSKWQGTIDWNKVRSAGVDFVMIKAGEGTKIEESFLRNITGAKAAGIQCGIYWFANARNLPEAHAEAAACINAIKDYKLEYPVVYDFEYRTMNNNPLVNDRTLTTNVIMNFMLDIEAAGYYSMFYSNKDFPQRYLEIDRLTSRFGFWYANHTLIKPKATSFPSPDVLISPDEKCGIWQYSDQGNIDGIHQNGKPLNVDLDISYIDYKSIMIKYKLNGF